VRYENIISEFKHFKYPDWLRDCVGILKLTFSILLLIGITQQSFAVAGGIGITLLMIAAFFTHLRVSNPFFDDAAVSDIDDSVHYDLFFELSNVG
jgi:uncharacterized membrane protein YphA (DoxX/SURF4 family)